MLVSRDIASESKFIEKCSISADKYWKRGILKTCKNLNYINIPVCKFYLDGFSSKRPNLKILKSQLKDKYISNTRKLLLLLNSLLCLVFINIFLTSAIKKQNY